MFDFSAQHIALAVLGLGVILAYWLPRFVSGREPAASALLITVGAVASFIIPGLPELLDPRRNPGFWEIASELALIVGLFGTGLRIDRLTGWSRWRPTVRLLAIAMPISIASVAFLGTTLAGMTFAGALLLGAVLAPTDPVLAGDVQVGPPLEGGEHPVRFSLTAEAGLNDGLAFPFVHLALAFAAAGMLTGDLILHWLWLDVLYRIAAGVVAGILLGRLLGKMLFEFPRAHLLAETNSGVLAIAGVLLCYGAAELVEGYGFIASFVAGLTLRRVEARHDFHKRLHDFTLTVEHTLTALLLVAVGLALPALWERANWTHVALGAALIFVIRPVAAWASLTGAGFSLRERLVVAFYGVRGIGSIYYIAYAGARLQMVDETALWSAVAITVLMSTVVHGLTAGIAVEQVAVEQVAVEQVAVETIAAEDDASPPLTTGSDPPGHRPAAAEPPP